METGCRAKVELENRFRVPRKIDANYQRETVNDDERFVHFQCSNSGEFGNKGGIRLSRKYTYRLRLYLTPSLPIRSVLFTCGFIEIFLIGLFDPLPDLLC